MQLFTEAFAITPIPTPTIGQPGALGFGWYMRLSNNRNHSPKGGHPGTIFNALWQVTNIGTMPGEPGPAAVRTKGILIAE